MTRSLRSMTATYHFVIMELDPDLQVGSRVIHHRFTKLERSHFYYAINQAISSVANQSITGVHKASTQ